MYMFNNRSSEETDYILFACKGTHFFRKYNKNH